ncbi:MAG: long-chain fatty acid--CoA ligase [Myxococcales bacterium]|nr:long-chain fatty acid--CoA ligase [Myxococcales bacterium]
MLSVNAPHVPALHISHSSRTLGDMLRKRVEATPDRQAFFEREGSAWRPHTWSQVYQKVLRIAAGLRKLSLRRGDRLAIVGPTQLSWSLYDLAAQLLGLVSFGIYQGQTAEQIHYLLDHSQAQVVLVGDESELQNVLVAAQNLPSLTAIIAWDEALSVRHQGADARLLSPRVLEAEPLTPQQVSESLSAISPDDTAILIYTSGTTGPPKGAMLSHRNLLSLLGNGKGFAGFFADDITISFLPMAHSAERVLSFYGRISTGVATAFASSMSRLLEDLREVGPTVFGSVPRIFEKAYSKILTEVERKPAPVRAVFAWARQVSGERLDKQQAGQPVPWSLELQHRLADRLLWRKIRSFFGGRVRYFIVGAAPTPKDVLRFFWAAGMPILEAYGMTEATAVTHANTLEQVRLGTVGKLLSGLEQKLAADGEILIRGPQVFQGYYRNPEATAQAIVDGWLHTGDIGSVDDDGFLRITDRKKHLIITAGGKNLSPGNIESALKSTDPLISHVIAHGDMRPYVSAIIAPSPLETLDWGLVRGLVSKEEVKARTEELLANPSARSQALAQAMEPIVQSQAFAERLLAAIRKGNEHLAHVEQVRRVLILPRDLCQEHGELTPTMKVRRREVEEKYRPELDRLYQDSQFGLSV